MASFCGRSAARQFHSSGESLEPHATCSQSPSEEPGGRAWTDFRVKRSENGVTLTAAGRPFWDKAGELVEQLDQAALRVKRKCGSGRLRIGYLPAFVAGLMPRVLARFKATIGGPVPELLDLTAQEIVTNAGKLDVAFLPRELEAMVPDFQWTSFRWVKPVLIMLFHALVPLGPRGQPGRAISRHNSLARSRSHRRCRREFYVETLLPRKRNGLAERLRHSSRLATMSRDAAVRAWNRSCFHTRPV